MFKSVLFFLALVFAHCTDAPAQVANVTADESISPTADNVTHIGTQIKATFPGAIFSIYTNGNGASVLISGKPQYDFEANVFPSQVGEWTASSSVTGDYVIVNMFTGVVAAKIAGKYGVFLPTMEGATGR